MFTLATKDKVLLKLLNSNEYLSGERLAHEFDISRAAVWKAIKALEQEGYNIEGIPKIGYRLLHRRFDAHQSAI